MNTQQSSRILGKTKVYIIDRADRILPFEDPDISEIVSQNLEEKGVTIHHNASLERLENLGGEVEYELKYPDGSTEIIRVEKALLSIGRVPNIENLNLSVRWCRHVETRSSHWRRRYPNEHSTYLCSW